MRVLARGARVPNCLGASRRLSKIDDAYLGFASLSILNLIDDEKLTCRGGRTEEGVGL